MPLSEIHIVIADDDPDDHYLVKNALKKTNYNYSTSSVFNGVQLLDYLLKQGSYFGSKEPLPTLILLDINMPVQNGFEALQRMKKIDDLKNIPVFVLSTSKIQSAKDTAAALGATGFYTKPSSESKYLDLLNEVISLVVTPPPRKLRDSKGLH